MDDIETVASPKPIFSLAFENISKIGLLFVLAAYLNTYLYYNNFGIDINPYIETTEIIFSLSFLIPVSFYLIIQYALIHITQPLRAEREKALYEQIRQSQLQKVEGNPKPKSNWLYAFLIDLPLKGLDVLHAPIIVKKIFGNVLVIVYAVGFLLLILSAFALIIGLLGSISLTETFYSVILFDGVSFILISIYYTFSPKAEKWVSAKFYFVLLALIFIYLLVRTHSRFNAISKGIADKVVEVKYDGKLISTTDTLIYIGSTRNYHFFYNTKNRQNTIIPAAAVTEFKSTEIRSLNK